MVGEFCRPVADVRLVKPPPSCLVCLDSFWGWSNLLGKKIWRRMDRTDALYEDCIGPSSYSKGQGAPVRLWGLLARGRLQTAVLRKGQTMNARRYAKLVRDKYARWARVAFGRNPKPIIVQDHERCLWAEASRDTLKESGMELLTNYPKSSQDLNSIETAWREVRARLANTEPTKIESRTAFIRRLNRAVRWVNKNRRPLLSELCTDQKERARDVLAATPPGGRTKH